MTSPTSSSVSKHQRALSIHQRREYRRTELHLLLYATGDHGYTQKAGKCVASSLVVCLLQQEFGFDTKHSRALDSTRTTQTRTGCSHDARRYEIEPSFVIFYVFLFYSFRRKYKYTSPVPLPLCLLKIVRCGCGCPSKYLQAPSFPNHTTLWRNFVACTQKISDASLGRTRRVHMRSRRSRQSDGLLDNDNEKYGGKKRRYNARNLLAITATVLALVWLTVKYFRVGEDGGSSSVQLKGSGGFLYSSSSSDAKRDSRHKRKKKKSKSKHEHSSSPDPPVCTPSPLEKKNVFPKYGCDDMEVSRLFPLCVYRSDGSRLIG